MQFQSASRSVLAALLFLVCCALARGEAPLADAAERNDRQAIVELVRRGIDVSHAHPDGMTALHWAAYHDEPELVHLLLKSNAKANAANRYGVTPLSLACTNGSAAIVEALLKSGADSNSTLPGGETALMTAARTGRLEPVAALLSHGAKVDARERKGQTALMWAAAEGHVEVVDALLNAGADFRTPLASGFTPLFFAVREGRTQVVLRLLAAGDNVKQFMRPERADTRPTNPLILAVENGHFELAAALLEAGADPNDRPAGYTPLHAITWVRKPIRGDGDPPPQGSGKLNSLEMVRALVGHHADLNVRLEKGESGRGRFTTTGSTPFMLAARASDVPLLKLLRELGADPNITNVDHSTPLMAAAGVGALGDGDEAAGTDEEALATAKLLVSLGADVNAIDDNGETAMHGAAYQSRPTMVEFLDQQQADIKVWNRKNKFGWTPLMIAQGHRPGNFRPAPDTIAAIERAMRARGAEPPPPVAPEVRRRNYN